MAIRIIKTGIYKVHFYLNNKQINPEDLKINFWTYIKTLFNKKNDILSVYIMQGKSVIIKMEIDV